MPPSLNLIMPPFIERVSRFWPLLVLLFVSIFCYAQIDISMLDRVSRLCNDRKVIQDSRSEAGELQSQSRGMDLQSAGRQPLPFPVAKALLHYATTTITPQQTRAEIMVTLNILQRRGPCNFLVYGLGHDSPLWKALNHGGLTVFLEEDLSWVQQMKTEHPSLQAYHVKYSTMLSQANDLLAYTRGNKQVCSPQHDLLKSDCKLAIKTLPPHVYDIKWDVIMIDAPRGYYAEAPGRMGAIYSSAVMAAARGREESTDILLHDVERPVEKAWGSEFLCSKNRVEFVGKLWHFQVYGQGPEKGTQFC